MASYGLIDTQIASLLGVCEATLNNYKDKKHSSYLPGLLEALNKGKDEADSKVTKSLYLRATGYKHEEVKLFCDKGRIVSAKVIKHYPPDATSMIFWLKNRRKDLWRDKFETEHSLDDGTKRLLQAALGKMEKKN